jgi:hypothetical protein
MVPSATKMFSVLDASEIVDKAALDTVVATAQASIDKFVELLSAA